MNNKYKVYILIASLLYIIYHFVTLAYSPLPWFDEVAFASITNSFIKHHTFYQEAISIGTVGENAMYGPLYFALQSFIIKLLGWTIFNFRLSNLVFGFINLYLIYRICLHFKLKTRTIIITIALIALERSYNQFLHSGRMDFMTVFFFLASYLVFIKIPMQNSARAIGLAAGTGLLMACAMLTTPRILYAFSTYFFYFLYQVYQHRKGGLKYVLPKYAVILLTFCALFYLWIYVQFGTLQNYIYVNYVSNAKLRSHVGLSVSDLSFNSTSLYFVYAFICLAIVVATKRLHKNADLFLFTVPVIVSFLLLVNAGFSGRYYAMVTPFVCLLIAGAGTDVYDHVAFRVINYSIIGVLFAGFIFKGMYICLTLDNRDPVANEQRIMQYIPAGATIAGDFEFYYFARRKNCFYQCLFENGTDKQVFDHFNSNNYQYYIFNKKNFAIDVFKKEIFRNRYTLIATVDDKPRVDWLPRLVNKMGFIITESYSCYIYKYTGGNSAQDSISTVH